jgi:tetratricopeptide (TPR) repeat protein
MRIHGSVSLALLALSHPLLAQEFEIPGPADPIDTQVAPELNAVPLPALPERPVERPVIRTPGPTDLDMEIEALSDDLRSFHALGDDVARSVRAAEAEADRTLVRQRQELLDALTRIATQGIKKSEPKPEIKPVEPVVPPTPDSTDVPAVTNNAVDQFALGKVLFRAGEYAKAEQAFRKVAVTPENNLMMKYLIATCLRKRSQWDAASEIYREVAESDKDPVLRDLARFHLDGIRWSLDTEQQIDQLRKQREKQSGAVKGSK